jgi:Asp-tRNA(Asn)/Glu-tRNA(Gln) amidotransferase A subunit family amidase
MSTHALTRRRLLQLLGAAGVTGPAAADLVAQARSSVSVENLRQASAILGESFSDDRLGVIHTAPAGVERWSRLDRIVNLQVANVLKLVEVALEPGGGLATKLEPPERAKSDVKPGSSPTPFRGGTTFIGDMTGLPAIIIPCGFTAGPPSLPLTIQFYGRPFDELTLFRVSHAYESATDWHRRRPPLTGGPTPTSA